MQQHQLVDDRHRHRDDDDRRQPAVAYVGLPPPSLRHDEQHQRAERLRPGDHFDAATSNAATSAAVDHTTASAAASVSPSATTILVNNSANIVFTLNTAATSNFAIPISNGNPAALTIGASNCVVLTGSRSCTVTVTTSNPGGGTQPLSPPVLLSPSASAVFDSTTTTVTFTWQAMAGATSYRFRLLDETDGTVNTSVLCPGVKICLNDLATTNTGPHAVTAGHNYSWWVHWVGSAGTVSEASGRTFSVSSGTGAPAPPSVRLIATAADSSTASIEWDAVAGTANYKVYRRAEDESSWTFIATTSATSTTVAIPGAGTYLIRVNITLTNGNEVEATKGVWVTR